MALKPVSVKQLNSYIKKIIGSDPILNNVSVTGEISNFKIHGSGHVYFNLKDESSKINCFLPSQIFDTLNFRLEDSLQVIAKGSVNIYERGGTYSLSVREIAIEGMGNLAIEFEKLKKRLEKEGIFDQRNKKPIPFFPKLVAVVTSETGAAVQDITKIIKDKNDFTDILIYPTRVQGEGAAEQIAKGIKSINEIYPNTDCIIVGRGGGSMEELWAFNEEIVARAIYDSKIPIISAVGHETDFTIADFAADKRAETPTAAAGMAVPDTVELRYYVDELGDAVIHGFKSKINSMESHLNNNRMDNMGNRLCYFIEQKITQIKLARQNIDNEIKDIITKKEHEYEKYFKELEALDPKAIMARGYSVLSDKQGKLISSVRSICKGERIYAEFTDGRAMLDVVSKE